MGLREGDFFMGEKRRRTHNRLPCYDYSQNGYYFVTICTWENAEWFGQIRNNKIQLSKLGKIVEQCWKEIPNHFPNSKLDGFVIMPNHVHGIIIINHAYVRNAHVRSVHGQDRTKMLLPKIIHGFKSSSTRHINGMQQFIRFRWKKSFYDHIIRDENDLNRIRHYIQNNPAQWKSDRNNPKNYNC